MERLRSTKPQHCATASFEDLVLSMNSLPDVVLVKMHAVDDVCQCHERQTGIVQAKALPSLQQKGRKYYTVKRKELFAFVNSHGKVCPHG